MMAKRFISTEMFNDEWICSLSKDAKLFFVYFITTCDHAGVVKLNKLLCQFQTKIADIDSVLKELGNSIVTLKDGVYWMPRFIKFQYPNFPQSNVKQQDSAIKILASYGIDSDKLYSYLTLSQELTNSYVYVNDNVNVNKKSVEIKKIEIPELLEVLDYCKTLGIDYKLYEYSIRAKYDAWKGAGWKDGFNKPIKNWKTKIQNAIQYMKPMHTEKSKSTFEMPKIPTR